MFNDFNSLFQDVYRIYPTDGIFCLELGEVNSDGKASVPFLGTGRKFFFADELAAKNAVETVAGVLSVIDNFIGDCNQAISEQLGEHVKEKISAACADVLADARQSRSLNEMPF